MKWSSTNMSSDPHVTPDRAATDEAILERLGMPMPSRVANARFDEWVTTGPGSMVREIRDAPEFRIAFRHGFNNAVSQVVKALREEDTTGKPCALCGGVHPPDDLGPL
jgi:hypothetical protein